MKPWQKNILCLSLLMAGTNACAQFTDDEDDLAQVYGDKHFVSIATGARQPISRAPAVATVVTAEDIAAMGATDLDEVLETVPGIHVTRAAARHASVYLIRGLGSGSQTNQQVLLLQNGIPMTTMFNGDRGAAWNGVPVDNVARVEIIRGPGSALYGADAYAGVINVITKTAAETPGTEFGLRGASFNTWSAWTQHGGELGPVKVAAYLRLGGTDGLHETIAADAQSRNDRLFNTHASLAPGALHAGHDAIDASLDLAHGQWRWRAGYKLRDHLETGAGINSALDPASQGKAEEITSDLSWIDPHFSENWALGVSASFLQYILTYPDNLQLLPPGTRLPGGLFPKGLIGGPNQWERQARLSAYATYSGLAGHSLRFGLGHDDLEIYKAKTVKNYLFNAAGTPVPAGAAIDYTGIQPHIRPQQRRVDYAFVQDEWQFAQDWALTAGLRHDRYSDFGGTTNPRAALVWEAAYNLTAKLLYGRAFRAPSFNEQYGINPVLNGNPNLRPETIKTVEAALSWQASRNGQLNLGVFSYDARNLIRARANAAPGVGTTFQNVGAQQGHGGEIEAVWDAGKNLRLSGNYAYGRAVDKITRQDSGYAPRHHLYARADWRFAAGWLAGTQLNRVAGRKRAVGDTRSAVPDYTTLDVTLRSTGSRKGWNFGASVRNLFDVRVLEPTLGPTVLIPGDLPLARRTFYLQLVHGL